MGSAPSLRPVFTGGETAAMSAEDAPTKTISDFEATLTKADTAVASFEKDDRTLSHILRAQLRKNPTLIPALVLLISIVAFSIVAPRFFGMGALSTVLKQTTVTGFIAMAQTLIILTAGIDLSVGGTLDADKINLIFKNSGCGIKVNRAFPFGAKTRSSATINNQNGKALIGKPLRRAMGRIRINNALRVWATIRVHQHGQLGSGFDISRQDKCTRNLPFAGTNELNVRLYKSFFTERFNDVSCWCSVQCCADGGCGTNKIDCCSTDHRCGATDSNGVISVKFSKRFK